MIRTYPSFFSANKGASVSLTVTLDEVRKVLEGFEKPKSLGPNGWTVEFFL